MKVCRKMKHFILFTFALALGSSVAGPLGFKVPSLIPFFGSGKPIEPPKNLTDDELLINAIVELSRLVPNEEMKKIIASVDPKISSTKKISKEMFATSKKEQLCTILDKMLTNILGVSESTLRSRVRGLSQAALQSIMYSLQPVIFVRNSFYNKVSAVLSTIDFFISGVKGATKLAVNSVTGTIYAVKTATNIAVGSVTGTVHAVQSVVQAANTINHAVNHPVQTAGSAVYTVSDAINPIKAINGAVNSITGTISEVKNNTVNGAKRTIDGITNQISNKIADVQNSAVEAAGCEHIVNVASDLKDSVSYMATNAVGLAYDQASNTATGVRNAAGTASYIASAPIRGVLNTANSLLKLGSADTTESSKNQN